MDSYLGRDTEYPQGDVTRLQRPQEQLRLRGDTEVVGGRVSYPGWLFCRHLHLTQNPLLPLDVVLFLLSGQVLQGLHLRLSKSKVRPRNPHIVVPWQTYQKIGGHSGVYGTPPGYLPHSGLLYTFQLLLRRCYGTCSLLSTTPLPLVLLLYLLRLRCLESLTDLYPSLRLSFTNTSGTIEPVDVSSGIVYLEHKHSIKRIIFHFFL